ncbi:DUF6252 family protein [Nafulsella turpanensis]|uniref:DUF6252 family protein n=1 Tax=Nafulsella turpanensis TaxID=1265690 RepID=UPI000347CDE6|nr:DUF6252 family protein [Nafulsella turpanensis]
MKKYFYLLCTLGLLLGASCTDQAPGKGQVNVLTAEIDSIAWTPTKIYTQKAVGENGPLTIVGEGEGFTLKLILRGITAEGVYPLNASRHGEIKRGNTAYTTIDIQEAGSITVTLFEENKIEGEFSFDAQWLSANNRLQVREGKFSVFYY